MSYLKRPHTRRVAILFALASILLILCPELDLRISALFFGDGGFHLAASWWATALHKSVGVFLVATFAGLGGLFCLNRVTGGKVGGVDAKVVVYVFVVLVLGAGLIVNGIFKNGFGRARPRNVVQFGGEQRFTPAFVVGAECRTNCSFSSGDSAGAFLAFALVRALRRSRPAMTAAAAYGSLVSLSRIASGAHFFSDTIVSFFVMWTTAEVLYHVILAPREGLGSPTTYARPAASEVDLGLG